MHSAPGSLSLSPYIQKQLFSFSTHTNIYCMLQWSLASVWFMQEQKKIKQLLVGSEGLSVRIYIEWRRGAPHTWSLLKEQSNIYGKYVWEDGYQSLCIWDISVCSTQIWCFLSLQRKLEWRLNSSLFRHHLFVKSVYVAFCHLLLLSIRQLLHLSQA